MRNFEYEIAHDIDWKYYSPRSDAFESRGHSDYSLDTSLSTPIPVGSLNTDAFVTEYYFDDRSVRPSEFVLASLASGVVLGSLSPSRRQFLRIMGLVLGGGLLASCSSEVDSDPQPTPTVPSDLIPGVTSTPELIRRETTFDSQTMGSVLSNEEFSTELMRMNPDGDPWITKMALEMSPYARQGSLDGYRSEDTDGFYNDTKFLLTHTLTPQILDLVTGGDTSILSSDIQDAGFVGASIPAIDTVVQASDGLLVRYRPGVWLIYTSNFESYELTSDELIFVRRLILATELASIRHESELIAEGVKRNVSPDNVLYTINEKYPQDRQVRVDMLGMSMACIAYLNRFLREDLISDEMLDISAGVNSIEFARKLYSEVYWGGQ